MRATIIILDSVGCGVQPDSPLFGDTQANTLGNTAQAVGGLKLPNLERLGLGHIIPVAGVSAVDHPLAAFGKMAEKSPGKDTITGHWEMMGLRLDRPFPVFPIGFPEPLIKAFQDAIGREILGNVVASGTEIIARLGEEHQKTGKPIVYTSADSVFQIAAHEEVIAIEELYRYCSVARGMLTGAYRVGRVIARPFTGAPGNYVRTANRRDYAIKPPYKTVLNHLVDHHLPVYAVGKIEDIFVGEGITWAEHTKNNQHGMDVTLRLLKEREDSGLIFTNLVEFDSLWGHRNDVRGYAKGLEEFDQRLAEVLAVLGPDDILIITADHGCDPTTPGTDHTREHVPLLICGARVNKAFPIGTRSSFADLAATLADFFKLPEYPLHGEPIDGLFTS